MGVKNKEFVSYKTIKKQEFCKAMRSKIALKDREINNNTANAQIEISVFFFINLKIRVCPYVWLKIRMLLHQTYLIVECSKSCRKTTPEISQEKILWI